MNTKKLSPSPSRLKCHSCGASWKYDKLHSGWSSLRHDLYCDVAHHNATIVREKLRT